MEAPIRTLVIGVGTRGKHWARLVNEEARTVPVGYVDLDPRNLFWAQQSYGASSAQCFTDYREALRATNPDLVVLATPPMGRLDEVREIFASGCHVLAEKPLSIDFAETIQIVQAAKDAQRTLTVGLNSATSIPRCALRR